MKRTRVVMDIATLRNMGLHLEAYAADPHAVSIGKQLRSAAEGTAYNETAAAARRHADNMDAWMRCTFVTNTERDVNCSELEAAREFLLELASELDGKKGCQL